MGYELYREVLRDAPADLCTSARLLLAVIADKANDLTRLTPYPPGIDLLCHLTGLKPTAVRKALRHLAEKGLDPRQPIGKDKNGNPVYAMQGRRSEYRIPRMPRRELPWEGVTTVTPQGVTTVTPEGVQGVTTVTGEASPQSPQGVTAVTPISSLPSEKPSSLSASTDLEPVADVIDGELVDERETDPFIQKLMKTHGANSAEVAAVLDSAKRSGIRSIAAWARSDTGREDFGLKLAEHRASQALYHQRPWQPDPADEYQPEQDPPHRSDGCACPEHRCHTCWDEGVERHGVEGECDEHYNQRKAASKQ